MLLAMSLANRFKNLYQGQLFNFWTSTAFLPLKISFIGMLRDAFRNKNGIMWEKFPRGQTPPPLPQYGNFFDEIPFFSEDVPK